MNRDWMRLAIEAGVALLIFAVFLSLAINLVGAAL